MRFSSAIVLTVAAALASSISAKPLDDNAGSCPWVCWIDVNCNDCTWGRCLFPFCTVSHVSAFTSVQYERWH
ncbi:hypothetical protein CY34DRAFT_807373 [Suillus luteus UH-Slu-Lm8-n1]|uniref:Uncharacterized protein n=1 Tax=Suillus luteus UH-Slu-Lm8-n1 TaxID=930992 RepID=A0A0D0AEY2_9AGAM|nr:hypothetical protein CY34DRAFT_807373 [Suillus luteus UH-Slu-Lm8-n1]